MIDIEFRPQPGPTYRLVKDLGSEQLGLLCLWCSRVSFHPEDIAQRYCGGCHTFHEPAPGA